MNDRDGDEQWNEVPGGLGVDNGDHDAEDTPAKQLAQEMMFETELHGHSELIIA